MVTYVYSLSTDVQKIMTVTIRLIDSRRLILYSLRRVTCRESIRLQLRSNFLLCVLTQVLDLLFSICRRRGNDNYCQMLESSNLIWRAHECLRTHNNEIDLCILSAVKYLHLCFREGTWRDTNCVFVTIDLVTTRRHETLDERVFHGIYYICWLSPYMLMLYVLIGEVRDREIRYGWYVDYVRTSPECT